MKNLLKKTEMKFDGHTDPSKILKFYDKYINPGLFFIIILVFLFSFFSLDINHFFFFIFDILVSILIGIELFFIYKDKKKFHYILKHKKLVIISFIPFTFLIFIFNLFSHLLNLEKIYFEHISLFHHLHILKTLKPATIKTFLFLIQKSIKLFQKNKK